MLALGRLLFFGLIILTVVYVCLSFYSRAVRKDKLRKAWHEGEQEQTLEAFVDKGLEDYDGSLKRKLILGVYVVPLSVVGLIIYLTNFA